MSAFPIPQDSNKMWGYRWLVIHPGIPRSWRGTRKAASLSDPASSTPPPRTFPTWSDLAALFGASTRANKKKHEEMKPVERDGIFKVHGNHLRTSPQIILVVSSCERKKFLWYQTRNYQLRTVRFQGNSLAKLFWIIDQEGRRFRNTPPLPIQCVAHDHMLLGFRVKNCTVTEMSEILAN